MLAVYIAMLIFAITAFALYHKMRNFSVVMT